MKFFKDLKKDYSYSLLFENNDLNHTIIDVSFDGLSYRFPKNSIIEWLTHYNISWKWFCKKIEVWQGEPYVITIPVTNKPPIISFKYEIDAVLFKLTWDNS